MSTYYRNQQLYGYNGGSLKVATDATTSTLRTVQDANHTIFLQRVHIEVTGGSSGKTWSITDSDGTVVAGPFDVATAPTSIDVDFGENGFGLVQGKDLKLSISAAGAGGEVTWEAYQKLTAVIHA